MKIKKGDTVQVVAGASKGKQGKILKTYPKMNKVIVEGVNIIKKHAKPTQATPDGGILEYEAPFDASNVMIVDPKTGGPTRVGFKTVNVENKKETTTEKIRYAKKSGEELD